MAWGGRWVAALDGREVFDGVVDNWMPLAIGPPLSRLARSGLDFNNR
jgi:hypothetical protein